MPHSLKEFASASKGTTGFLLDFKGGTYQSSYYGKCIEILKNNGIVDIKVAWSKAAKTYFYQKESVKIGLNYSDFLNASSESTFSKDDYFLLASGYDYNETLLQKAKDFDVEIVVSINEWSYRQRGITDLSIIEKNIQRMIDVDLFVDDTDKLVSIFRNMELIQKIFNKSIINQK